MIRDKLGYVIRKLISELGLKFKTSEIWILEKRGKLFQQKELHKQRQ